MLFILPHLLYSFTLWNHEIILFTYHVSFQLANSTLKHGTNQTIIQNHYFWFTLQFNPDGYMNMLIMCTDKDGDSDDKVVVRIFGDHQYMSSMFHIDTEIEVLNVLSHNNIIPPILTRYSWASNLFLFIF